MSSDEVAAWEKLDFIDLDTDPFIMGRQARCIGAGCPFRSGTPQHRSFHDGWQFQNTQYRQETDRLLRTRFTS